MAQPAVKLAPLLLAPALPLGAEAQTRAAGVGQVYERGIPLGGTRDFAPLRPLAIR